MICCTPRNLMRGKMNTQRGVVVSTPVVAKSGLLSMTAAPFDAQELRYWLLFWDKLNFPLLEGISIDPGEDGHYLQDIGILRREIVRNVELGMSGDPERDSPEEQFQHHFLRGFRALDASEPGVWSLATGANSLTLDEDHGGDGRGVLFSLHRSLPVPARDVPLAELLEFKRHRNDELVALRHHLERAYQRIVAAPDSALALRTEFEAIDASLSDLLRVARESSIKKWMLASTKADLQILPAANVGVAAYYSGLPLAESVFTGVVAGLSISASSGLKDFRRSNGTPWRYVVQYHDEVFFRKN